jgi:flagellar basal body-associated protein FliL
MMIIIIALLVLLLGTVVVVTIYLISAFGGNDGTPDAPLTTPSPLIRPEDIDWTRELEEVRTNLLEGPGRNVFIVTTVLVGVNTTAPTREMTAFDQAFSFQVARTIVNEVLFSTTYAEAKTPEGRRAIEERIKARLQVEFGPLIVGVRTPEWVIP